MLNPPGKKISEITIAKIGNRNPILLSFILAVPNNAIAPIAVKLAGCGKKRVAAANAIRVTATKLKLMLFFFIIHFKIKKKPQPIFTFFKQENVYKL